MTRRLPKKPSSLRDRQRLSSHNWLVNRLHDTSLESAATEYARGVLVDVGCGIKPYKDMFASLVSEHIGVDHEGTLHDTSEVDILGSAYDTTLSGEIADTVLCTAVLEHLERPADALHEMARILKPGGHLILSAPLFWHLHEEPRDFYRYTRHGLTYLLNHAGFEIVELHPLSGFAVTVCQALSYVLLPLRKTVLMPIVAILQFLIQFAAYLVNSWDPTTMFTWAYLLVARKSDHS